MKKLIVNADDFGLTPGVNRGILDAARAGVVTSTSVMVSAGYVQQALDALAASGVRLGLGLHIQLNGELATFSKSPLFTNSSGFLPMKEWDTTEESSFLEEMRFEIRSQFEAFQRLTGQKPDHIDSHHNICFKHPLVKQATMELLEEERLPIRDPAKVDWLVGQDPAAGNRTLSELRRAGVKVVKTLRGFRGEGANLATLSHLLKSISDDGVYELMCHVGYVDETLMSASSYNILREVELNALTSADAFDLIKSEAISLMSYAEAFDAPQQITD